MYEKHVIKNVEKDSIASECGLEPGDVILAINDTEIKDVFDYQYLTNDDFLKLKVMTKQGEEVEVEVEKDFDEELGIEFENDFMDDFKSCKNKCIFCFIDQLPENMRKTLYFKDDDSRLSFLQGNYVTMTNMSEDDVDRIIKYHLEPVNISFQTMNPKLRVKMLNNRFAGEALKIADRLFEAGITMNGQIVLCKGINDGEELEYSLSKLYSYLPNIQSLSVVPVGLSDYRDGLYELEAFNRDDANKVIDTIEKWQSKAMKEYDTHFVHASDEWYLLANRQLPDEESYDGYLQFENGVGMLRSMINETFDALIMAKNGEALNCDKCSFNCPANMPGCDRFDNAAFVPTNVQKVVSVAVGVAAFPTLKMLCEEIMTQFPKLKVNVYCIVNKFFGESITVSGLITGGDLIEQLKGKELGDVLLISQNMLNPERNLFLDDVSLDDVVDALQVPIDIVKSNGYSLVEKVIK